EHRPPGGNRLSFRQLGHAVPVGLTRTERPRIGGAGRRPHAVEKALAQLQARLDDAVFLFVGHGGESNADPAPRLRLPPGAPTDYPSGLGCRCPSSTTTSSTTSAASSASTATPKPRISPTWASTPCNIAGRSPPESPRSTGATS